jgi:hypothetical protein
MKRVVGRSGLPVWLSQEGKPVSCLEKVKVLNENLDEIRGLCQEAIEDSVLMGCDEAQFRQVLHELVDGLDNPYTQKK